MRQLRYSVAMSLDGFIAGAHGEYDWITFDASMDFVALFEQFDTLLMGRDHLRSRTHPQRIPQIHGEEDRRCLCNTRSRPASRCHHYLQRRTRCLGCNEKGKRQRHLAYGRWHALSFSARCQLSRHGRGPCLSHFPWQRNPGGAARPARAPRTQRVHITPQRHPHALLRRQNILIAGIDCPCRFRRFLISAVNYSSFPETCLIWITSPRIVTRSSFAPA